MKKALTAIQPSGFLHLGNYIGAIEPAVRFQEETDLTMFIVDYHAITVHQEPKELRRNILSAAATYLACGIDPVKTMMFQQSRVSAHTELAWILQCAARMGEAERMTQFKDKAKGKGESVSVGLFTYPILMAADILLYDTQVVPVGEDQKQHVELARDLAERFNKTYGDTFVIPEPRIRADGARVMGLDDATKKMSKSATSAKSYISLTDESDAIRKKIMSAVTDSGTEIRTDRNRPAITNLLTIFSVVTGRPIETLELAYVGKGYGEFKKDLAEAVVEYLAPIQTKISLLLADETELKRILEDGAKRANARAEFKMRIVRQKIGVNV
jgi:tryptophanyl-tRNA synthetase